MDFKVELDLGSGATAFSHPLHVVEVTGEERIGAPYRFVVDVVTAADEPVGDDVVSGEATLRFTSGDLVARTVRGVVQSFEEGFGVASPEHRRFRLVVMPRLADLARFEMQDVYIGLSQPEVIRQKLALAAFKEGDDFRFSLRQPSLYGGEKFDDGDPDGDTAQSRMIVQYRESDLAFLSRLAEHVGIAFYFDDDGEREVIAFTDHTGGYKKHAALVPFGADRRAHGISLLRRRVNAVANTFFVYDYSYRTPQKNFEMNGKVVFDVLGGHAALDASSPGARVEYAPNAKTSEEAALLATVRADVEEGTRERFHASGACPELHPGVRFALDHHPTLTSEEHLLVVGAKHSYVGPLPFTGAARELGYVTELDLVRADKKAKDGREIPYRPERSTPRPRIYGVVTGIVKAGTSGMSSAHQNIDAQGRYTVKLHFDQTPATLPRIRMAQPSVGEGYGQHFPLRPGAEVLVAFLDGDPDRPVILGAVPNPLKPSPVTTPREGEPTEVSKIQTRSGIRIQFSDGTKG